jgi:hypothetical protein
MNKTLSFDRAGMQRLITFLFGFLSRLPSNVAAFSTAGVFPLMRSSPPVGVLWSAVSGDVNTLADHAIILHGHHARKKARPTLQ